MRVLLLNPPARGKVIRDYYCSKSTKSNYLFQPIDLLMQSGILTERHELFALDAVAKRMSADECLAEVGKIDPEVVLGLWGAVTDSQDQAFYERLAVLFKVPLFVTGEVFLDKPEEWLQARPFVTGVLLRFVSTGLLDWLESGSPGPDLVVREGGGFKGGLSEKPEKEFRLGRPRHELFGTEGYHFSFARGRKFATVLTDFGCPFTCSFCVMSCLGYRVRPTEEVVEELKWLRQRGIGELFVTDQCFGAWKKRSMELLDAICKEAPGLGWTTFTRADLLDHELLAAMKGAGCHTVIMGVESASQETLDHYKKKLELDKVRAGFRLCREQGVRTVATFILGLPEDTEQSIRSTMKLARELDPDFVSYNVAVPRAGTSLGRAAKEEGLAQGMADPDQAGDRVAMRTRSLSREQVAKLKSEAIRDFYLRPGYLARRVASVDSFSELFSEMREGAALLLKNF